MRTTTAACMLTVACCTLAAHAEELVVRVADPGFVATVPDLPPVQLGPHPAATQNPSAKLFGAGPEGLSVSALVPKAEGASQQQCASWLVGSTLAKNVPDLTSVQIVPAGANAWVLIYSVKAGPIEQLKAHVFSGNNKGQCLEVHMSRVGATEQQRQAWFAGFRGVAVKTE
jgi:hypothetical protein